MSLEADEAAAGWLAQTAIDWAVRTWSSNPAREAHPYVSAGVQFVLNEWLEDFGFEPDEYTPYEMWSQIREDYHLGDLTADALVDVYGESVIGVTHGLLEEGPRPIRSMVEAVRASQVDIIFFRSQRESSEVVEIAADTIMEMSVPSGVSPLIDNLLTAVVNYYQQLAAEKR